MFDLERREKLFKSPIFLFIYFAVFSEVIQRVISYQQHVAWKAHFAYSLVASLFMTILALTKIKQFEDRVGSPTIAQKVAIQNAIKTGITPTDPATRKALPKLLDYQYTQIQKARKWVRFPIILIFGVLGLLTDLLEKPHTPTPTTIGLIVIGIWSILSVQKAQNRLEHMYQQIGMRPPESQPKLTDYALLSSQTEEAKIKEPRLEAIPFEPAKPEPGVGRNIVIAFAMFALILAAQHLPHISNNIHRNREASAKYGDESTSDVTITGGNSDGPIVESEGSMTSGSTVKIDPTGSVYGNGDTPGTVPQSYQAPEN